MKNVHAHQKLQFFLACFLGGVFFSPNISFGIWATLFLIFAFNSLLWRHFFLYLLSALCLGGFWSGIYGNLYSPGTLLGLTDEKVKVVGIVSTFPEGKRNSQRAEIEITKINEKPVTEKALLVSNPKPSWTFGDEIQIIATPTKPRNFDDFDYVNFLKKEGIYTIFEKPENLQILSSNNGGRLKTLGFAVRNKAQKNLEMALPIPHSTLAMGMLFGVKEALPKYTEESFRRSGLTHLLVVSGANVALVVLLISGIFRRFGRLTELVLSLLAILFYAFVVGGDAPVLRASLMGGLAGLATAMGRMSQAKTVLLYALFLLAMINPLRINYDIGLQLSAYATLGLLVLSPPIERFLSFIPSNLNLRKIISTSLAAEFAIIPLALVLFKESPSLGLLANVIAEPLVPFLLLFSFFAGVFGSLSTILPLGVYKLLVFPLYALSQMLLGITEFFSTFPVIESRFGLSKVLLGMSAGLLLYLFFRPTKKPLP